MSIEALLEIKLISEALIGSGEGWGAAVDSDVVFDKYGIPYIPARRIKGLLRDSALEIGEMLHLAGISSEFFEKIGDYFGIAGMEHPSPLIFNNLRIDGYKEIKSWLQWMDEEAPGFASREALQDAYTVIRQQTALEMEGEKKGTARQNSLRTVRVLKPGSVFKGTIGICGNGNSDEILKILALSSRNLRRMGTMRTRGKGKVSCELRIAENSPVIDFSKPENIRLSLEQFKDKKGGE